MLRPEDIEHFWAYETARKREVAFVARRNAMFESRETFWGRNRFELHELERVMKFPQTAYHELHWHDVDLPVIMLKRRYLNRLRQALMKGRCASDYMDLMGHKQLRNHINRSRVKNGFPEWADEDFKRLNI